MKIRDIERACRPHALWWGVLSDYAQACGYAGRALDVTGVEIVVALSHTGEAPEGAAQFLDVRYRQYIAIAAIGL